jgi:hypothetical protein
MNAADLYRRAFDLISDKDSKVIHTLSEDRITPENAGVMSILNRASPALEHLHAAAKVADCDWGIPLTSAGVPEFMKVSSGARLLAMVAALRARIAFQQGQPAEALDDLLALLALARHVGRGRIYISGLVQFAIEPIAILVAAPSLPHQEPAALQAAMSRIDALPESLTLSDATQAEKVYFLNATRAEAAQLGPTNLREHIRASFPGPLGEAMLTRVEGDPARFIALIDQTGPAFDQLADIWALPYARIDPALAAFRAAHAETNPLALSILEQSERMRPAFERATAQRALFRAALVVAAGGAEQLATVPDPFGTGPFQYRPFAGGFELTSAYEAMTFEGGVVRRRPIRLIAGVMEPGADDPGSTT